MPQGLEVYGPNGELEVHVGSRMTRMLGRVIDANAGSLNDPQLTQGSPFVAPILNLNGLMYPRTVPAATISGQTVSWPPNADFYYGTY